MPDTAGSPGHQFPLTAREVGLCVDAGQARNKLGPLATESTSSGVHGCVPARLPVRQWRPVSAPGMAPFYRAPKTLPAKLQPGATIMADDDIKRIPIRDIRQEEGAHELVSSPDMKPYLEFI